MEELISIIVPVYNVEKTLSRCIDSILKQSYENFELILINDGSKDISGNICDNYKRKDNRIRVMHTENKGVSIARNTGINLAKGSYLFFIDSDDMVKKNIFIDSVNRMKLYSKDICIFGYELESNKEKVMPIFKEDFINETKEIFFNYPKINSQNSLCFSWRFGFKSKLIKDNNILFEKEIKIGEDTIFNIDAILNSNGFCVLNKSVYIYNDLNVDSTMRKKYKKDFHKNLNKQYLIKIKIFNKYGIREYENFMHDLYKYQITTLFINSIKNIFNGPENLNKEYLIQVINLPIFKDSLDYFSLKNLKEISDNKIFLIFLMSCKYKIKSIIYIFSKYILCG